MNVAAKIARPLDNNPITLLMLRSGKDVVVTPPDGFQLLTDEHNRILRDEQRNYLTDRKEVNTNGKYNSGNTKTGTEQRK